MESDVYIEGIISNFFSYFGKVRHIDILNGFRVIEEQGVGSDSNDSSIFDNSWECAPVIIPQPLPQTPEVGKGSDEWSVVFVEALLISETGRPEAEESCGEEYPCQGGDVRY